jgi:hypothetical protein
MLHMWKNQTEEGMISMLNDYGLDQLNFETWYIQIFLLFTFKYLISETYLLYRRILHKMREILWHFCHGEWFIASYSFLHIILHKP